MSLVLSGLRAWVLAVLSLAAAGAAAQIRIGQPAGFTGPVATGVKEITAGAMLYLDTVNVGGGIHGQKVELLSVDDHDNPKLTAELGRKLITEQGVIALFLNRGTPHTQALIPLLNEFKVPLVAPSAGAMMLHRPMNTLIFNVRAPYQREAEKVVQHLATIGINRIAILQVDDTFGADCAEGALRGFRNAKLDPLFVEKFDGPKPNVERLAGVVARSNAQAVIFIAAAATVAAGTRAIREAGSRAQVVTLSNNASGGFIKLLGEHASGVIVSQVFPYERSLAAPIVKEAADLARARGIPEVTPAMLEGFAGAKVLVEGLRRAGPRPTPARLTQALESLRKFNIGGMEITYGPNNRTGLDFADLSIIGADGKFRR